MLKIYRSNRSEWLAKLLAEQLKIAPPEPFDKFEIIVNTWSTSRWLGEELSVVTGINTLIEYPFPNKRLKELAQQVLNIQTEGDDPWETSQIIWHILELMPDFIKRKQAIALKCWIEQNSSNTKLISRQRWKLAKSIASTFDDYILYRPEMVQSWLSDLKDTKKDFKSLPIELEWQPLLLKQIANRIGQNPSGMQIKEAIKKLTSSNSLQSNLPKQLHFFGISSLAPVQIELIQSLSGVLDISIYLLTPCPDLWKRSKSRREQIGLDWRRPLDGQWLLQLPRIEATLGRIGAEFQQLLEGSGETQLGELIEGDLFAAPITIAERSGREASLLEQIQQQLANPKGKTTLHREREDKSLFFIACPGNLRQVQLIRDQIIQFFAEDSTLEPRDILIMTPQVDSFSPLITSVFNDISATGVEIPWTITDRNYQQNPGLIHWILQLIELSNERLSATALERLLSSSVIQAQQNLSQEDIDAIMICLHKTGFTWGLNKEERNGDETHSLCWCLDRWLLGLVMPNESAFNLEQVAPFSKNINFTQISKWWPFLSYLVNTIVELRKSRTCSEWVEFIKILLTDLFKEGGEWRSERKLFLATLQEWKEIAGDCKLDLESDVVSENLQELLTRESSRHGHRSGRVTFSNLKPMRAIPYRVIILMGLDSNLFPRKEERPSYHLMEKKKELGDPKCSDHDRYIILESLLSARDSLIITWNCRNERTGETNPPSNPVQQLIGHLENQLTEKELIGLHQKPVANPIDRANFISEKIDHPISCDARNLQTCFWREKGGAPKPLGLALPLQERPFKEKLESSISFEEVKSWLITPQLEWLKNLQLNPKESLNKVQDLDSLELTELERYSLLKERLEYLITSEWVSPKDKRNNKDPDNYWEEFNCGTGVFPPGSAAKIEMDVLLQREQSISSILINYGPFTTMSVEAKGIPYDIFAAGDFAISIQIGKLTSRGVMEGWLTHLLTCTSDNKSNGTIVIARRTSTNNRNQYEIALKWEPLEKQKAMKHIDELFAMAAQGQQYCWPVPPESGWLLAYISQEDPIKGVNAFTQKWNGNFKLIGEREKPEMQLCYGASLEASALLNSNAFKNAHSRLYTPILKSLTT